MTIPRVQFLVMKTRSLEERRGEERERTSGNADGLFPAIAPYIHEQYCSAWPSSISHAAGSTRDAPSKG
jgi:hypothetical protein